MTAPPPLVVVEYAELTADDPAARASLDRSIASAFTGEGAYGIVGVRGVPGFADARRAAFGRAAALAVHDAAGRERCASVRQSYPGWNGTPGVETHPLQANFLHNIKEEVGRSPAVDGYFGKNRWPSESMRSAFTALNAAMYPAAVQVMAGADRVLEAEDGPLPAGRLSLEEIAERGTALAGRWIWYDSAFSRDDNLLETMVEGEAGEKAAAAEPPTKQAVCVADAAGGKAAAGEVCGRGDSLASMRTAATATRTTGAERAAAGEVCGRGDSLASMRTAATATRTTGAERAAAGEVCGRGDSLASMRTAATATRTTGAEKAAAGEVCGRGDSLASMRTAATATRTTGADGGPKAPGEVTADDEPTGGTDGSAGEYWLPWHIDSQFITLLTPDEYFSETDGSAAPPPPRGAGAATPGLTAMNARGDVASIAPQLEDDIMLVQIGGFAQIYTGGRLRACRHAVKRPDASPGIARTTYCNFWYAPWELECTPPPGASAHDAVRTHIASDAIASLMDDSYVDVSMRLSFQRFRDFFVSLPVADEPRHGPQPHLASSFHRLGAALPPLPPPPQALLPGTASAPTVTAPTVVIDILTDIRCPYSFVANRQLSAALAALGAAPAVALRAHPCFVSDVANGADVPEGGEDLSSYLSKGFGLTVDDLHSPSHPLQLAATAAGVTLSPDRRVVSSVLASCAVSLAAEEKGLSCAASVFDALCSALLEGAQDISQPAVVAKIAQAGGLAQKLDPTADGAGADLTSRIEGQRARVLETAAALAPLVPSVPHFLIRRADSGHGTEVVGMVGSAEFESALLRVLSPPPPSAIAGVSALARPSGMRVTGLHGRVITLPHADPVTPVSLAMRAWHDWVPPVWPYGPTDFGRIDESIDTLKYATPHIGVTHLDPAATEALAAAYDHLLPPLDGAMEIDRGAPSLDTTLDGAPSLDLLDTCSSWTTNYPPALLARARRVAVHGLNKEELEANTHATETLVQDLNTQPAFPYEDSSFDLVSNAMSFQYLTQPRAFVSEARRLLKPGGLLVVAFSNRLFEEKAVAAWRTDAAVGPALVQLIATCLHHGVTTEGAAWSSIESVDVSPTAGADPLWLVVAVK